MQDTAESSTGELLTNDDGRLVLRRVRVRVASGPSAGREKILDRGSLFVGSHASADLMVDDKTVSRQHLEVSVANGRVSIRDLESKNGVFIGGARVREARVELPIEVRLGTARIELLPADSLVQDLPAERTRFGTLVGKSHAMRTLFSALERIARVDTHYLVEGEAGAGKSELAAAVHVESARAHGPLVAIDCSAGASELRAAADDAHRGTLVLDRLSLASRSFAEQIVAVAREIEAKEIDVRMVGTSREPVRRAVEDGRLPRDLYFALGSIRVVSPPLRERLEDVPLLLRAFASAIGRGDLDTSRISFAELESHGYPQNVRELRVLVEREAARVPGQRASAPPPDLAGVKELPYKDAKEKVVDAFTREYLAELLARHGGSISKAASDAGLGRNHLARLLKRHGLR